MIQELTKENFDKSILVDNFKDEAWFSSNNLDKYLNTNNFLSFQYSNTGIICTSIMEDYKAWIYLFAIKKEFQRRKIGSILLNYSINKLRSKNYKLVVVDVDPDSIAYNFYRKFKFKESSIIEDWFDIDNSGILMYRKI